MNQRYSLFIPAAVVFWLVAVLVPQRVQAASLAADNQALLLLRTLAYDRNLKSRVSGGEVVIAVVFKPGSSESESMRSDMMRAIRNASQRLTVAGLAVRAKAVAYDNRLGAQLEGVSAVYLCAGLAGQIDNIHRVTRSKKILSATGEENEVREGLSLGLVQRGSRAAILVNLKSSKAEGADLDSALLRMAEIIR